MLIKINLKDAACMDDLKGERFLAFVEVENALLRPAAACCLVESVSILRAEVFCRGHTEAIEANSQFIIERKYLTWGKSEFSL